MLQHINLYTCEGPSADASTFNTVHILLCSSMLTLVMVGFIVWSYFDYQHLLAVTDKSEQGYARLMTQYNQISGQLTAELGEQNAEEAVQSLKNDIEAQKALLDLIEQRINQGADFSTLTRMLTSHQFDGLTIERIAFAEGGEEVAVTGRVRSSHEMADYLLYLASIAHFDGHTFDLIALGEQEALDGWRPFKLSSHGSDGASKRRRTVEVEDVAVQLERRLAY